MAPTASGTTTAATPFDAPKQPDIEYHPDEAKYRARVARLLAENPDRANVPLPDGLPKQVVGPIVWEGKDWASENHTQTFSVRLKLIE